MVQVVDEPKARTRRKTFHYILEASVLRHTSKYASSQIKRGDKRAWTIKYDVPKERIFGKQVYEFTFTNSGNFIIWKYSAVELLKELGDRKLEKVSVGELRGLRFELESEKTTVLLRDEETFYAAMVREINKFKTRIGMDYILASPRVSDFLTDLKYGEASCLCNYPESSRQRSLEGTFKFLHQWWVLKIVHEALKATKIERGWSAELGKKWPASIFIDEQEVHYTCWFEPQIIREALEDYTGPLTPFSEGEVIWKRPDLIISRGEYVRLREAKRFDVLIECKNLPFERWWLSGTVMNDQLLPYKELFKPQMFVVASLKPIPELAKRKMKDENLYVVDKVYPGGEGVSELTRFLCSIFLEE